MIRKCYKTIQEFQNMVNQKNISAYAASTAFFMFVSMIPFVYLICSVIGVSILSEDDYVQVIMDVVPATVADFFVSLFEDVYAQSAGKISIAILITIWIAGKGVMALMKGLNVMNGVPEDRNYFFIRGLSGMYTVVIIFAISIAILSMGIGKLIFGRFIFLYLWAVLTFFFSLIYTFIPNRKIKLKSQIPGAIFCAVVWTLFSFVFSIYVDYFGGFDSYGSLTTIVIVLLWMYFMIYIILIGACLNQYLNRFSFTFLKLKK